MTRPGKWILLVLFAAVCGPAMAFESLELRPLWPDPALLQQPASMELRLSQADSLDALLISDPTNVDLRVHLVRLYRGSELMKHRVLALEYAGALPDSLRRRELALTYARTFNPWEEEKELEAWIDASPSDAEAHRTHALYRLREGLFELDAELLEQARLSFVKATECEGSVYEDWLGLAATLCAEADFRGLRPVAQKLVEMAPEKSAPWLYLGLAHEAFGQVNGAAIAYRQGFGQMHPRLANRFVDLGWRQVLQADLSGLGSMVEPPPLPDLRCWWARLIQAEVIFGDDNHAMHAWDNTAGQAFLLYGRPLFMKSLKWATLAEIMSSGHLSPHSDSIGNLLPQLDPSTLTRHWIWIVKGTDGREMPLVFDRMNRFARWMPTPKTEEVLVEEHKLAGPRHLPESIPEVSTTGDVSVAMFCTGFRARDEQMRVEAWVSARDSRPGKTRSPLYAELVLRDASGVEIDRVRHDLDSSRSRRRMGDSLRGFPADAPGWITGFGALVGSGRYSASVEVRDSAGELHAILDQALNSESAEDGFGLSELLLCDAYTEGRVPSWVPPEFIRHARLVVPHPEYLVHSGQEQIYVYYEVYGAELDAAGLTRLEVQYEVFAEASFDPIVGGAGYIRGELARPVSDARFPDQRTGAAAGGIVVKGTRVDLRGLDPGVYVVVVRVSDQLAKRESQKIVKLKVGG